MSNPFKLKKEPQKTPFKKATMVVLNGPFKKFLFDKLAVDALGLNNVSLVSFIVDKEFLCMVDVSNLNLEEWGIKAEEVNKFYKNDISLPVGDSEYKFRGFANHKLFKAIQEEFEIVTEDNWQFELNLVNKNDFFEYMRDDLINILDKMNIESVYYLIYRGSWSLNNNKIDRGGWTNHYDQYIPRGYQTSQERLIKKLENEVNAKIKAVKQKPLTLDDIELPKVKAAKQTSVSVDEDLPIGSAGIVSAKYTYGSDPFNDFDFIQVDPKK